MELPPPHPLVVVTPEDVKMVRQLYATDDRERINEDLKTIEEWIYKQEHLAEAGKYMNRTLLERIYIISKGSLEGTKKKIEKTLTYRGMMPEICLNRTIEEFQNLWDCCIYVPLSKLCPSDRSRVMVTQFLDINLDKFSMLSYFRYCYLIGEYRLHFDYTPAERFIVDLKNVHIGLLGKFSPVVTKKAEILCSEGIGTKIKGIHLVNAPPFVDKFIMVLKQALREKIANRIHVHSSYEDLQKYIPREILPKDYGGDEPSCSKLNVYGTPVIYAVGARTPIFSIPLDTLYWIHLPPIKDDSPYLWRVLHKQWHEILKQDEAKRVMKNLEKLVSDESKRHESKFNEEYMGMPGSFRRLTVD